MTAKIFRSESVGFFNKSSSRQNIHVTKENNGLSIHLKKLEKRIKSRRKTEDERYKWNIKQTWNREDQQSQKLVFEKINKVDKPLKDL